MAIGHFIAAVRCASGRRALTVQIIVSRAPDQKAALGRLAQEVAASNEIKALYFARHRDNVEIGVASVDKCAPCAQPYLTQIATELKPTVGGRQACIAVRASAKSQPPRVA